MKSEIRCTLEIREDDTANVSRQARRNPTHVWGEGDRPGRAFRGWRAHMACRWNRDSIASINAGLPSCAPCQSCEGASWSLTNRSPTRWPDVMQRQRFGAVCFAVCLSSSSEAAEHRLGCPAHT